MAEVKPKTNYKNLFQSTGKPGEMLVNRFRMEEDRVDELMIEDYRRMINNDGQIQMLCNALFNTILSTPIEVQEDEEYEGEGDSEEKQFIEKCLFTPKWKGGMSIPFMSTNRTMLRAFIEGYRVFEVVYKEGDEGKIVLDKLAPRASESDRGMKLKVDENGNFIGFHQRLMFANEYIDVEVLNTGEAIKVVKPTYGEEYGSLYGRSGLKAVWYHYDKAHKGMFLNHVAHEHGASKFVYVKAKGKWNDDKVDHVLSEISKFQGRNGFIGPESDMELIFETLSDPSAMAEGKNMINLHYSLIAKSMLAQFIDLGSNTGDGTGSRALGETQMSFFKSGLQAIATTLIEAPWNEVIASLIKINFGGDIYPSLKVSKIADESSRLIYDALMELVKKGEITTSVKGEIVKVGSKNMGLDVSEEEIDLEIEQIEKDKKEMKENIMNAKAQGNPEQQPNKQAPAPVQRESQPVKTSEVDHPHIHLDEPENRPVRPLFPEEQNVSFIDIKYKFTDTEQRATSILRNKLDRHKEEIANQYVEAMREGKKSIKRVKINLAENESNYSDELLLIAYEMMEYGKIQAAKELLKSVPTTNKQERQELEDEIGLIIEEQTARLTFRLINVANNALQNNIPENEARILLEQEFEAFFNTVLAPTIYATIPKAFNRGTLITFKKYSEDIWAYRYTAILDNRTTEYCRRMDGTIVQPNDPNYALLTPPNHFGCRSRWVAITKALQKEMNYVVNGKPNDIPVYSSIDTFKDIKLEENLTQFKNEGLIDRQEELIELTENSELDKILELF